MANDGKVKLNISLEGVPQVVGGLKEIEGASDSVAGKTEQATGRMAQSNQDLMSSYGSLKTIMTAVAGSYVFTRLISEVNSAINAIDSLRISTIQIAAQITTMQGPKNVAEHYAEATKYAGALAVKLQEVDANSFANYQTLLQMTQTMTLQGVVLDVNNKKQVDAFTSLSNAVAMYTAGQNQSVQAHQEIRALMSGEVTQGSQLAMQINDMAKASGLYKNGLKELVAEGKKHGDTLERLAPFLVGINAASGDIATTWQAVTSSAATAKFMIESIGFRELYQDAIKFGGEMVANLKTQAEYIGSGIARGWLAVKGILETISILFNQHDGSLRGIIAAARYVVEVTNSWLEGWAFLISTVLPTAAEKFNSIVNILNAVVIMAYAFGGILIDGIMGALQAVSHLSSAIMQILTGDFVGAKNSIAKIFGSDFKAVMDGDLAVVKGTVAAIKEEWGKLKDTSSFNNRFDKFIGRTQQAGGPVTAPVLPPVPGKPGAIDNTAVEEQNKYADFYNKLQEQLIATTPLQEKFDKSIEKARFEFAKMNDEVAPQYRATLKGLQEQVLRNMEVNQELARSSQAQQDSLKKEREEAEKLGQAYARMREHYKQADDLAGIKSEFDNANIELIKDPGAQQAAQIAKQYDDQLKAAQKYARDLKLLEKEKDEDITDRLKANAELQKAIEKAKNNAIGKNAEELTELQKQIYMQGAQSFADSLDTIGQALMTGNKAQFEAGKAMAITSTIISTYLGAQQAFTSLAGIPIVGPALGVAAAAAAVVSGLARVSQIESQEYQASYAVGSKELPADQIAQVHKGEMIIDASSAGVLRKYGINISGAAADNYETVAAMQDLRRAIDNNSLAVARVADGFTKIAGSMKDYGQWFADLPGVGTKEEKSTIMDALNGGFKSWAVSTKDLFSFNIGESLRASFNVAFLGFGHSLANGLFGGDQKITGQGIQLGYRGGLYGGQYTNVKTDGGWFSSDKNSTVTSSLPGETQRIIADTVTKIRQTTLTAAEALGTGTDGILAAILPLENIDLRNLDADAASKKIEEWMQKLANAFAGGVSGLDALRQPGEESFDALVRLAGALQGVNEQLELIGGRVVTSTLANADAASKLADAFGGLDKMQSATDKYFDTMFTEAEQKTLKAAQAQRQVNVAFAEMGIAVPPTREAFRNLVDSLDVTTASGAATFKALMDTVPAFDTFLGQVEKTRGELLNNWADAGLTQAQTMLDLAKQGAEFYRQSAQTIQAALTALRGGDLSILSPEQKYLAARAEFAKTANLANAGDKDALSALPGLAQSFAAASRAYNASGPAYVADFNLITQALDATGLASAQLANAADVQVDLLTTQVNLLTALRDELAKGVDANVTALRELATAVNINSDAILASGQLTSTSITGNTGSVSNMVTATNAFTGQTATYQSNVSDVATALGDTNSTWRTAAGGISSVSTNTHDLLQATSDGVGSNGYVTAAIATTNEQKLPEVAQAMVTSTKSLLDYYGAKARYDIQMGSLNTVAATANDNATAAMKFATGGATPSASDLALLDVAPIVSGVSTPDGKIDTGDVVVWLNKQVGGLFYNQQQADIQAAYDAAIETVLASFTAHATGGVASGWSIVGEKGPELANFTSPARVYTADDTRAALSGNGNRELVSLLKSIDAKLDRIEQHEAASVRVQADGLGQLVKNSDRQAKSMAGIESKARLEASNPARSAA